MIKFTEKICENGNVGIGTTSPQDRLEVIGAVTLAGGVNASSLNVTGFSITDDSLVTLSDGTKKKIKDVKAGEEVLTLDETTGKLVPRKVNALLDHGIKPIYEMTTGSGRAINTTAEHPYYVKLYDKELCDKYAGNVWNKEANNNEFEKNGYCTRWVEVKNLEEGDYIAVPIIENNKENYLASLNCINSSNNLGSTSPSTLIRVNTDVKCTISSSNSLNNFGFLSMYPSSTNLSSSLFKSFPVSAINNPISPIVDIRENKDYLKLSDDSDIFFDTIASIKTLEAQHVYDLSIEGTRNFIANDIVAHNTYLATSSGNVGIGTTTPAEKLTVSGNISATGNISISDSASGIRFGDGSLQTSADWGLSIKKMPDKLESLSTGRNYFRYTKGTIGNTFGNIIQLNGSGATNADGGSVMVFQVVGAGCVGSARDELRWWGDNRTISIADNAGSWILSPTNDTNWGEDFFLKSAGSSDIQLRFHRNITDSVFIQARYTDDSFGEQCAFTLSGTIDYANERHSWQIMAR